MSAYPFGVEFIDSLQGPRVSQDRILDDVKGLYDASSGKFLDAFVNALHRVRPKSVYGARIQIVSTEIGQGAADALSHYGIDVAQAREFLESAFERYLSVNGDVPVLPHANNQAIGGSMAARFENGDVFNFEIPPPDYSVHLTLSNMRKVEVSRTPAEVAIAYASYLDARIDQPLSGRAYLDASFKYPVVKIISTTGLPDDTSALQESLLSISDQITKQFASPEKRWRDQWSVRESDEAGLDQMPHLLEHCR